MMDRSLCGRHKIPPMIFFRNLWFIPRRECTPEGARETIMQEVKDIFANTTDLRRSRSESAGQYHKTKTGIL